MKRLVILLSLLVLNDSRNTMYCDIKGNVKNPGVYEVKKNYTVQDVIVEAGGLKNNSYTDNINLSKKVTDEMVIYIFNNKEIQEDNELNNCVCTPIYKYIECDKDKVEEIEDTTKTTTTTSFITTTEKITTTISVSTKPNETTTVLIEPTTSIINEILLININTASLEELITLKGLGEKKAEAIIEYRKTNKFEAIEDIMNVSGIGKSTFDKIKEYIEV